MIIKSLLVFFGIVVCVSLTSSAFADSTSTNSATVNFDGSIGEATFTWDLGTPLHRDYCIAKTEFKAVPSTGSPYDDQVLQSYFGTNTDTLYINGTQWEDIVDNSARLADATIPCQGSLTFNIPDDFYPNDIMLFMTIGEVIKDSDISTHNGTKTIDGTIDDEFANTTIKANMLHEITIQYTPLFTSAPLQCGGDNHFEVGTEYFKDKHTPDTFITLDVKDVCTLHDNGGSRNNDGSTGETQTTANDITLPTPAQTRLVFPSDEPQQQRKKSGGGCSGDCTDPSFGKNMNYKEIVKGGFELNGNVTDVFGYHVDYDLIILETNQTHNMKLKVYEANGLEYFQVGFGIPEIGDPINDAESIVQFILNKTGIKEIVKTDKHVLLDIPRANVTKVSCGIIESDCYLLDFDFIPRDQFKNNVVKIQAVDKSHRSGTHYINDGIEFVGESLNEPLISHVAASNGGVFYPQDRGTVELTLTSYKDDLWQDPFGYEWTSDNYKSFRIIDTVPVPIKEPDVMWQAMTRINSNFPAMIIYEQQRAVLIFDSTKLISEPGVTFAYDAPKSAEEKQAELDIRISNEIKRVTPFTKDYTKNQHLYQKDSYNHWNHYGGMTVSQINQLDLEKKLQLQDELYQQRIAEQQKYQS